MKKGSHYVSLRSACEQNSETVLLMYYQCATLLQISKAVKTNPRNVKAFLVRHGLWDRGSACELHHDDVRQWAAEGLALADIGRRIGTKNQCVRAYIEKHQFPYHRQHNVGSNNQAWKGGRIIDQDGYVLLKCEDHPHANSGGYVREHRLVMERILGRFLDPKEVVHHKDESLAGKQNNHPSNLVLYDSNGQHLSVTLKGKRPNWTQCGIENLIKRWTRMIRPTTAPNRPRKLDDPKYIEQLRHSGA